TVDHHHALLRGLVGDGQVVNGGQGLTRHHRTPRRARSTPKSLPSPSAARFRPITSAAKAMIGHTVPLGATVRAVRFSWIIRPQSGVGGLTPKPRKDNVETSSTTHEARMANSTRIVSRMFGSTSRRMIATGPSPRARAART